MKTLNKTILVSILTTTLTSFNVQAEEQQEKRFSVGIGTYALNLAYSDDAMGADDEFSGLAISAAYAFTDNVAVKGALYSMEHDDISGLDASGLDLVVVGGTGLATHGFKIYGGGGIFNETWEFAGYQDEKFSGIQLVGGLGYNWDVVSVDLSIAIRDSDDYADFIPGTGEITAVSGGLTVSARF